MFSSMYANYIYFFNIGNLDNMPNKFFVLEFYKDVS